MAIHRIREMTRGPRAKDAEIIPANKTPISSETLHQLPKSKFVGVLATGYNIVDTEAARDRDLPV